MLVALARNPLRVRSLFPVSYTGQRLMPFDVAIEVCDGKYVHS